MKSQKDIEIKVLKYIREKNLILPSEKVCVALSGGADSICLLDILFELKDKLKIKISACHFNHRLRGVESDEDQKFVEKFCAERGIQLYVDSAPQKNKYKNENEAREARYHFFQKVMAGESQDKIALGHHLNDLAETVIMRTVRGSGNRGLKSIPALRGKFCRPLLSISRIEIESYLRDRQISFRMDSTNDDDTISRNLVRHQVLPLLSTINPNIIETLGNSANVARDDYDFLLLSARASLNEIILVEAPDSIKLDRSSWIGLHNSMKRLTLRLAIEKLVGLDDLTFKQIEEAILVIERGEGKKFKPLPHSLRIELRDGKIVIIIHKKEIDETKQ